MGKFIQTYSYHGNLYGLTIESIESVARDGLACVVHMELEVNIVPLQIYDFTLIFFNFFTIFR